MKKQIILSSLLSALLIGNCLDTQAANEARTINDLPSMAKVSQNKREVSPEFPGGITALVQFLSKNLKFPTVCKEQKIQGQSVGEIYSQERWLYLKYSCYQVCRSLFG